ncbi:MAG: hypothetical protein M3Y87_02990, partial [Myxococcota bacterium]|nr:hypothetical protein [Myxococcota bacterium]
MIRLLAGLADPETRAGVAQELAAHVGARACIGFVIDAGVGAWIVAPGFGQRVLGGPGWRDLVSRLVSPGVHRGAVEIAEGEDPQPVIAVTSKRIALVFVAPSGDIDPSEVFLVAPLLEGALCG